jgi:Fe-S cluster assembly protein SufD
VRGFFGEIIAKIALPDIRERLTDAVEHELAITESRTQ